MGTHPKVVADMLGHASVTVTLDTYSHAIQGIARKAAATWTGCSAVKAGSLPKVGERRFSYKGVDWLATKWTSHD